jgi:peptidoglycan/LPS O-acetylase OafA/YrhL
LTGYRADIDGLRAVAVTAVILFHAKVRFFTGGFVGVDVFFVISGYLITQLILADLDRGRFSLTEFYARRIRRIFPALYVVAAATVLVGWAMLTPLDLKFLGESIFATATFSSNFLFWLSSGYFAPPLSQWPLLHTWSLSLEEQYYVAFPLLLLLLTAAAPRYRTALIIALAAASLLLCVFATGPDPRAAFFLAPFRVWEFLGGALLALGAVPQTKRRSVRDGVGAIGLVLIAVAVFVFTPGTRFPGAAALLPVLGTAALIWAGEQSGTRCSQVLSLPPLVLTGKLSYSLYLWHFPILALASYVSLDGLSGFQTALLIALTAALSFLSWKFVEQPVRARRWVFGNRLVVLGLAALVAATAGAFGLSAYVKSGVPDRFDAATARVLAAELELATGYRGCTFELERAKAGESCRIGTASAAPSFVLWGDSHADALRPGIALTASSSAGEGRPAERLGIPRTPIGYV